jgi:hypothetical protein
MPWPSALILTNKLLQKKKAVVRALSVYNIRAGATVTNITAYCY